MYANLRKSLENKNISFRAAALTIGMPEVTFRSKMDFDGRYFTVDEAFAIRDELLPEMNMRYLFATKGATIDGDADRPPAAEGGDNNGA